MMKSSPVNRPQQGPSLRSNIRIQVSSKEIHLRAGQIFNGKVVSAKSRGFIQVTTGGKTVSARTSIPLVEGKSYSFQVKTVAPRIELKIVQENDSSSSSVGRLWVSAQKERLQFVSLLRNLASSPLLKDLGKFLPLLLYTGPEQEDALRLSQGLLSSGMFWENNVLQYLLLDQPQKPVPTLIRDDLKGILLLLRRKMEHSAPQTADMGSTIDNIDRLLSFLEDNQILNLNMLREGWGWYWFIPGADRREFLHGELVGRRGERGKLHHVHMNLSFSRLGEIHVDCVLSEKNISLSIQVTSEHIGRFLNENIGSLEKGLEKQGLVVTRLACEVVPDRSPFNFFSKEMNSSTVMDVVI